MIRKTRFLIIVCFISVLPALSNAQSQLLPVPKYRNDFNYFWSSFRDEYCYFQKKKSDWNKVKDIYAPQADSAKTRDEFVSILEHVLYEVYDHHAILNTNTDSSQRLVPSGTDIWAEYVNGKPVITEIRKGFGAERAGIHAGMEVVAVNDIPVETGIRKFLPASAKTNDDEARSYALRTLLAGNHVQERKISLLYKGNTKLYFPDQDGKQLENIHWEKRIETLLLGQTGYIRINDCLYSNDLIPEFDSVMQAMQKTGSLIIDLRNCPSGGNTLVAKAILSWFIQKEMFYQEHEYYGSELQTGIKSSWKEIVSPRAGKYYSKPLVILCDHWTGSIAEGITIGFDAMKRPHTRIIGTNMARLNGAVYSYEMPDSKIRFSFPAERLYHVNGTPRESYIPQGLVAMLENPIQQSKDPVLDAALAWLKK